MVNQGLSDQESVYTILVADGNRLLAKAIAATLIQVGLQPVSVHDGNQALELVHEIEPDLILLDVMLPGKSGFEVCAALKRDPKTEPIPIIILTAKAELSSRMAGMTAGANAYLTKPFSPIQLIELIKETLAGRSVEPGPHWPDPSPKLDEQWMIYARELAGLFEQERTAHQELEQALKRLDGLNQLKMDFLGVITHELLTPFGAIGLTMEVLQRQSKDIPADCRETLDNLTTDIAGLHQMINGVVKFAELMHKQRDPEFAHYDLKQLVPYAVQPVAVLAQARGVDFRCLVHPDTPRIFADPELLGEAVFQMAHNAVKFNKPGGRAQVRVFEAAGKVVIKVTDTGVGLTTNRLALLGQPFEQRADSVRRGREGLGVGWTYVGYVAQVHCGQTHVASPGPDQGSTFALSLPIVAEGEET